MSFAQRCPPLQFRVKTYQEQIQVLTDKCKDLTMTRNEMSELNANLVNKVTGLQSKVRRRHSTHTQAMVATHIHANAGLLFTPQDTENENKIRALYEQLQNLVTIISMSS